MPDSATATTSGGDAGGQRLGPVLVDRERAQVPLVDPDQARPGRERPLELGLVVHLHQRGQTERGRPSVKPRQLLVVERGGDQQDGIGPHEAGIDDVELGHGEVLAQDREVRRRRGPPQVVDRAAEVLRVGQHREARCAAGDVLLGHQIGLEVGIEIALGRRAALDLGDAGEPARPAGPRRSRGPARAGSVGRLRGQLVGVPAIAASVALDAIARMSAR